MHTQKNITRHELVGLNARVVESRNPANIKIVGKIVDETMHTLVIEQAGKDKRVFKSCVAIEVDLDGKSTIIHGKDLEGRPWDRVKKKDGN